MVNEDKTNIDKNSDQQNNNTNSSQTPINNDTIGKQDQTSSPNDTGSKNTPDEPISQILQETPFQKMIMSMGDSHAIAELTKLMQAYKDGKKFYRWATMEDDKVRPVHRMLDGWTFSIEKAINGEVEAPVPGYLLKSSGQFDPQESYGCRCHVEIL